MKNFKKILSLLLVVCMLASVLTLTSCKKSSDDDNNDQSNDNGGTTTTTDKTYTVTIVDGDNSPVEGAKLTMTDGKTYPSATSDKNGKASVSFPEGTTTVSVMVTSTPDGYEKPEKVSGSFHGVFASGSQELTITLTKKTEAKETYTVRVVDQNGDAVVGMEVQLCPGGVCLADKFITDANGEISKELEPNLSVSVQLKDMSGYILPTPTSGTYHAVISEGSYEVEITVTKI